MTEIPTTGVNLLPSVIGFCQERIRQIELSGCAGSVPGKASLQELNSIITLCNGLQGQLATLNALVQVANTCQSLRSKES